MTDAALEVPSTTERATATPIPDGLAEEAGRRAGELGRRFRLIGRAGWVAKGIVYLLIGVLAFTIAGRATGGRADASAGGAIATVADRRWGGPLVVAIGVGLALYVIWRLFTVVLPGDWTGMALLERIGYLLSALVYASLGLTIVQILRTGNSAQAVDKEDRQVADWVGRLMANTGGRWAVALVGAIVAGVAVAFARKAWTRSFEKDLALVHQGARRFAVMRLGQVGHLARALSFLLISFFLIRSAATYDPGEVGGIDGSMRRFADYPWGRVIVAVIAAGFVAYGLFCVVSAHDQRLRGPRNEH
jgi:hypothetical protein